MTQYRYKMFVNKDGDVDWYRRQLCASTTLTRPVSRDDIIVAVDSIEDLFGGDLSEMVMRQYTKQHTITDLTLSVIGNGVSALIVTPEYWADNPITVEIDGVATTAFSFVRNHVTVDTPPPINSTVVITVVIQGITYPPLATDPKVLVNGNLLSTPDDFTVELTGSGTRIVLTNPLNMGDQIVALVAFYRSGFNVAWIGNERVEFHGVDLENSRLLQVRRGTHVTAAREHAAGVRVWDGSARQSLRRAARSGARGFTEEDLLEPEWNQFIVAFLAEECTPPGTDEMS